MTAEQKITLGIILAFSLLIGVTVFFSVTEKHLKIEKYGVFITSGLIAALIGVVFSVLYGASLADVLTFKGMRDSGKSYIAYIGGCIMLFSGFVLFVLDLLWLLFGRTIKKWINGVRLD